MLVIIGLISGAVIMTIAPAKTPTEVQASAIAGQLNALAERGLLSNQTMAAGFSNAGYALYTFNGGAWQSVQSADWAEDTIVRLHLEESPVALPRDTAPLIVFEPTGLSTPFALTLIVRGQSFRLESNGDGRVVLAAENT